MKKYPACNELKEETPIYVSLWLPSILLYDLMYFFLFCIILKRTESDSNGQINFTSILSILRGNFRDSVWPQPSDIGKNLSRCLRPNRGQVGVNSLFNNLSSY